MESLLKTYTESKNNIFQSEVWQDFLESLEVKTWMVPCDEEEALVVKMPLYKEKYYLYVPHGPACSQEGWHVFLKKLKEIARTEKAVFVRIEPLKVPNGILKELRFKAVSKYSPMSHQYSPRDTLLLDIEEPEEKILSQMKPKGRYNIRLAERKGVKVRQSEKIEDLKEFYKLSVGMQERGFSSFDFKHYQNMLEILGQKKNIKIFVAEHKKNILSCILVLYFNEIAVYLHGASGNEERELMPNHLVQWHAILEAKKRGCKVYDFWGIAPNDDPKHSWAGITRFKKSFGGEPIQFLGAYDFTFSSFWYKMFFLANTIKKVLKI